MRTAKPLHAICMLFVLSLTNGACRPVALRTAEGAYSDRRLVQETGDIVGQCLVFQKSSAEEVLATLSIWEGSEVPVRMPCTGKRTSDAVRLTCSAPNAVEIELVGREDGKGLHLVSTYKRGHGQSDVQHNLLLPVAGDHCRAGSP